MLVGIMSGGQVNGPSQLHQRSKVTIVSQSTAWFRFLMNFLRAEQQKARDRQLNSLNRSFSHLCRLTFPGGCRPLLFLSCMEAIHIQNNRILAQVESVENKASIGAEANTHTNSPEVLCLMTPAPASPGILPSHTVSTLDTLRETFPYGRPSPHRTIGGFAIP